MNQTNCFYYFDHHKQFLFETALIKTSLGVCIFQNTKKYYQMISFQINHTKSELKDKKYFDPDKTRTCKNVEVS